MKLTLAEPKYLKDSISIISELVNEARFKVTREAIELVAMDPANVAMVIFKLLSTNFVEYEVDKDQEIGLNLNNLKQVLKRAKANDVVSLELVDNKLQVTLRGSTKRAFSLPILKMDEKEQKVPELSFPLSIMVNSEVLNEAVEDVDIIGESVSLAADKELFTVAAEGDLSKAKIEIRPSDQVAITTTLENTAKAKYSIEYLKKMIAGSKIASQVRIQFNDDYPLRLEYKSVDKVLLAFILAPRVEND